MRGLAPTGHSHILRGAAGVRYQALIARCRGAADVVDAVKLARKLHLEVAVRSGGHNVAGRATIDGGLMIDLMPMKGIQVDPRSRTVRAQGGVTWAELNRETQLHGLAVTGGSFPALGSLGSRLAADWDGLGCCNEPARAAS